MAKLLKLLVCRLRNAIITLEFACTQMEGRVMDETGSRAADLSAELRRRVDPIGTLLMDAFHFLGLFAIGAATFWAAAHAFLDMTAKSHASVEDLLLLFIYL
jgi:hypothetical protein